MAGLAALALLFTAAEVRAAPAPAQAPAVGLGTGDALLPDPAVRRGRLPNGLRYAILSHARPAHHVSIRLRFDVGSWVEGEDERGAAHFLEHMAFEGGKGVPTGELEKQFAARGVAYGRDQNAATGLWDTTYTLDLPVSDPAKLDLAFAWLRDVADGLTLAPEAVDRQRGIILHEREAGLGPQQAVGDQVRAFQGPDLRRTRRDPLGTEASIKALDAPRLRAFYRRWYRPENALLVIVGDASADELEARVRATFASFAGQGPAPVRPSPGRNDRPRPLEVLALAEPSLPEGLSACWERAVEPERPESVTEVRHVLVRALAAGILTARLSGLVQSDHPPYLGASVAIGQDDHEAADTCLSVRPINGDWSGGLAAAERITRQFLTHGPTQVEIDYRLADQIARGKALSDGAQALTSPELAADLLGREARHTPFARFDERLRVLQAAAQGITPQAVLDQARRDFQGAGPLIVVAGKTQPDAASAKAEWAALQAEPPLPPFVPALPKPWAYADFGPPGHVVSRTEITDPGFTRLTLSNGVIVNFKQVDFAPNQVLVHIAFGAGRSELPGADQAAWKLGAGLLPEGGFKRQDINEVRRLFHDKQWNVSFGVSDHWFDLLGRTTPADLELQLQVLTAFLTEPGFRDTLDARLPTAVDGMLRARATSPETMAAEALLKAVTPDADLVAPSREKLLAARSRDFERLFAPALTGSPIEVTVIGDIAEAKAVPLLEATVGALPPRTRKAAPSPQAWWLRFPTRNPPRLIHATHEGSPEKALVLTVWPLYIANPAQRREERTIELLTDIFRDELRHRIREQMGDTYTPEAENNLPDYGDQGELDVAIEASPARTDEVLKAVRALAADLAAGHITAQELEAVRQPKLDAGADRKHQLTWWLGAMAPSAREPGVLIEQMNWEEMFRTITLDEVKAAAKKWLSNPGMAVVVMPKG
jgi:zinc protease